MIEVLLLEHRSEDALLIVSTLRQISPDVHIEWVRDGRLITDFLFCTGVYSSRDPQRLPRIILLDMTSPVIGLELLRTIKAYVRTRVVPVVVLINPGSDTTEFRGADFCIVKTHNREQFAHDVELVGRFWLNNNPTGLSQNAQIRHNHQHTAFSPGDHLEPPSDQPSALMDEAGTALAS
jgi:two-component system, response regulator